MGLFDRNPQGGALVAPAAQSQGGGGGITWSTPINANVTVNADNTWDLGANGTAIKTIYNHFQEMYDSSAYFYMDNLAGQYLQLWLVDPATSSYGPIPINSAVEFSGPGGIINSTGPISFFTGDYGDSGSFVFTIDNATGGDSGDFSVTIGTATGAQGEFKLLKTGVAPSIGDVWTASAIDGTGYWAAPSGGANTSLSNLTSPTAINQHLLPGTDDSLDLGSLSARYRNFYAGQYGYQSNNGSGIIGYLYAGGWGADNGASFWYNDLLNGTDPDGGSGIFADAYTTAAGWSLAVDGKVWLRSNLDMVLDAGYGNPTNKIKLKQNTELMDEKALRFYDTDSSNYVAFKGAGSITSNVTWTLPSTDGSSGQVLSTNGAGVLSWASAGSGANTALSNLAATAFNADIIPAANDARSLGSSLYNMAYVRSKRVGSDNDLLLLYAADVVSINSNSATPTLNVYGNGSQTVNVRFLDADLSNYVALRAPGTVPSNVTWVLPSADASSAGQALLSDAAGNMSWSAGFNIESTGRAVFGNAEKHSAVNVTAAGAFAVSATTHRTLFCWPTAAAAAINLNLPPGENGLEFIIKDVEGGAGANNITFVPDGSDSVEAGMDITTNWGARHIQYNSTNNTWFIVGLI